MTKKRSRIPESVLKRVGARYEWRCAHCRNLLECVFELDHVNPLHLGGADTEDNLRPLCVSCHAKITQQQRIDAAMLRRAAAEAAKGRSRQTLPAEIDTAAFVTNRFLKFAYVPPRRPSQRSGV